MNDIKRLFPALAALCTTGQPGIGFFIRAGGTNNLLTITSLKAASE